MLRARFVVCALLALLAFDPRPVGAAEPEKKPRLHRFDKAGFQIRSATPLKPDTMRWNTKGEGATTRFFVPRITGPVTTHAFNSATGEADPFIAAMYFDAPGGWREGKTNTALAAEVAAAQATHLSQALGVPAPKTSEVQTCGVTARQAELEAHGRSMGVRAFCSKQRCYVLVVHSSASKKDAVGAVLESFGPLCVAAPSK